MADTKQTEKQELTVYELLADIQKELKAPKGQYNKFGDFNYRSLEDILTAIKPLLNGATILLEDEIVLIGDRYYVKATAYINYNGKSIFATAYAREPLEKKGMDSAQITGATSSYARKYAMNGLFAIDDVKDPDTMKPEDKKPEGKITMQYPTTELPKDPPKPKADQVLYAQIWAKIMSSRDIDELAVQAKRIKENEHLLDDEMIEKLTKAGTKKKKELQDNITKDVT